jgi:hypothetical protein
VNYLVQAYTKGQWNAWIGHGQYATQEKAIVEARKLHEVWKRKVRVVDQEERVLFELPVRTRKHPSSRSL